MAVSCTGDLRTHHGQKAYRRNCIKVIRDYQIMAGVKGADLSPGYGLDNREARERHA